MPMIIVLISPSVGLPITVTLLFGWSASYASYALVKDAVPRARAWLRSRFTLVKRESGMSSMLSSGHTFLISVILYRLYLLLGAVSFSGI